MRDWSPVLGLPLWVWLFILPSIFAMICLIFGPKLEKYLKPVWRFLDSLYFASGAIAAFFMITILVLIVVQMVARWTSMAIPGTTEFAGYAMAATSFFALCHALTKGAHIRVSIILNANQFLKIWLDRLAVFGAALIATYFARYAIKTNILSEMLNDRTQGQDQIPEWIVTVLSLPSRAIREWDSTLFETSNDMIYTPVWVPQLSMSIGTVLLAVALWDTLYRMLITGENPIVLETIE